MPQGAELSDKSEVAIRELSTVNGVELVDATPVFRAYSGADPLYFAYDMHWTPAGHRVMAQNLENYLVRRLSKTWCR